MSRETIQVTGRFAHYQHDPSDPHSLSPGAVSAILEDRSGALWIGHDVGGGLSKLAAGAERFGHYRHLPDDANSLSGEAVTSLFEDRDRHPLDRNLLGA